MNDAARNNFESRFRVAIKNNMTLGLARPNVKFIEQSTKLSVSSGGIN